MSEIKIEENLIVFEPVAGWTINRAIAYSIDLAAQKNKNVQLLVNDIKLDINEKSNVIAIKELYKKLLDEKYAKTK